MNDVASGKLIDHFKVLRQLGSGGSADVYLARDTQLGRLVAIKLLRGASTAELQEARTLARLDHPNIVRIFTVGQVDDLPYLALEYVAGATLRARIDDQGRLAASAALRWIARIAEALAHAHAHGVVHGDLKPENVLVTDDGRLRLFDFELGARADRDDRWVRGSRAYMAPEQWRGERLTGAVDIWALGVVLHELLAGRRPHDAAPDTAAAVCSTDPTPLDDSIDAGAAELLARLLDKDPSQRPAAEEVVALLACQPQLPDAPFVGLRPLQEHESALFFGREREIVEALERLRQDPTLIVAGPSGVGKTSLARAGIAARLQEQQSWELIVMRPGERPFVELATQLAARLPADSESETDHASRRSRDDLAALLQHNPQILPLLLEQLAEQRQRNVLLLVDGLEELCTAGDDRPRSALFLEAILGAADDPAGPIRTLLTLRDDYIGAASALSDRMRRALSQQLLLVERPASTALEEIICLPLAAFGYRFDDEALPAEMIATVAREQHALTLLAFVVRRMWDHRDASARRLTRSTYDELGGIAGALARHATSVLSAMTSSQVERTRLLLLQLVTSEGTRRAGRRADLLAGDDDEEGAEVLERLIAARLLVVRRDLGEAIDPAAAVGTPLDGEAVVELAHETLIARWDTLARWLQRSQAHHAVIEELDQATALWQRRGRRDDELWSGEALAEAERVIEAQQAGVVVSEQVRAFVAASRRRQLRRKRADRARWALLGAVVAALLALWLLPAERSIEPVAASRVDEPRRIQLRRAVDKLRAAREALLADDPLRAAALVRASVEAGDSLQARGLWWRLRPTRTTWRGHGQALQVALAARARLAILPDGVWSAGRKAELVAVSRDATQLVSASSDEVLLHDLGTARTSKLGRVVGLRALAFASNPFALTGDGILRSYRRASWGRLAHLPVTQAVSFDCRDESTCAVGAADGRVLLWRKKRAPIWLLGHDRPVRVVRFAGSGSTALASGDDSGAIYIWNLTTGAGQLLAGHHRRIAALAFDQRAALLASAAGATVRLWRIDGQPAQPRAVFRLAAESTAVALSNTAEHWHDYSLLVATSDRSLTRWEAPAAPARGHAGAVLAIAAGRDQIISAGADRTLRFWDSDGTPQHALATPERIEAIGLPEVDIVEARSARATRRWQSRSPWRQLQPTTAVGRAHSSSKLAPARSVQQPLARGRLGEQTLQIDRAGRISGPTNRALLQLPGEDLSSAAITDDGIITGHRSGALRWWAVRRQGSKLSARRRWFGLALAGDSRSPLLLLSHRGIVSLRRQGLGQDERALREAPPSRWARAVARSWIAVADPAGELLCIWQPSKLQAWRRRTDRRLVEVPLASPRQIIARSGGCVSLTRDGVVSLHRPDRPTTRRVARRADAIGALGDVLLIAEDNKAYLYPSKPRSRSWSIDVGATALTLVKEDLLVGFADGSIARYGAGTSPLRLPPPAGSSAVTALCYFRGLLVVGHRDGTLAAWLLDRPERLFVGRLHGRITALIVDGAWLHAMTDLGDHHALDLSPFAGDHCALLRQLWGEVPVLWEGGRPVLRPAPAAHPCAAR